MLSLDDPRWATLGTRVGDGSWVPGWLRELAKDPDNTDLFDGEWPALVSEDTTWPAGLAAFEHLVDLAERSGAKARLNIVIVLGMIVKYQELDLPEECAEVWDTYRQAIPNALALAGRAVVEAVADDDEAETKYLLSAIAAFYGFRELAERIEIDALDPEM